jgi:AcrR family transcriptional regulator
MNAKQKIIDTAGSLFAQHGFQKTTIKKITEDANVNIAAANYYFGSKYALIEKVIEHMCIPINSERVMRLNAIKQRSEREGSKPAVKDILRAFIEPPFINKYVDKNKEHLLALSYQIFLEQDKKIISYFMLQFKEPLFLFFQLLCKALPHLPKDILSWRMHFTIGVAVNCMKILVTPFPIYEVAPPLSETDNKKELVEQIIDFTYAGIILPYKRVT